MKKFIIILLLTIILTSLRPSYCAEDQSKASPEEQARNKFDAGKLFYDQGNYIASQEPFKEAVKQYPNSVEFNWYCVDSMVVRDASPDAFNEAVNFYNEQIGINANPFSDYRSGLYFGLGLCYFMKGAKYQVDDITISGLKNKIWFEVNDRVIGKLKSKFDAGKLKKIKTLKGRKFSKDEFLSTLGKMNFTQNDIKTLKSLCLNNISSMKLIALATIKDRVFTKEDDFSNSLRSAGFKDYECTVIKSYALKFDEKNKEDIIKYFTLSLNYSINNECAKAIMDIKNTHKQTLSRIEKPRDVIRDKYIKIAVIAGILIILFFIIGPVRSYIKSKQPKFTGIIFLFNPEGEKIEDQMLEKYRRVNGTTISVGSDGKNGIVIPSAKPFHALLKAEKLVYQYRVSIAPQKDAKLFLVAKERDQKGNETGVSFTVEFHGGLLYDSDVVKFGNYFMQYINSNVPKRTQEEVLQMLTALHPSAMKEKPHEEQKPVAKTREEKKELSGEKIEVSSIEGSSADYEDKEKMLKEKLLSRRHEDSSDEAIDLGAPAFSGAILFSQDKEKEIKDAIARAKAKLQQAKGQEEEEPAPVEEEEEAYEQYMSIVGVTSVQADELTGTMEYEEEYDENQEYDEEEYDEEEYDEEEYDEEVDIAEEKITEKAVPVVAQEAPSKIEKESIKDAIEKVKTRMKLSKEDSEPWKEEKEERKEKKYETVIKPDEDEAEMLAVGIGFDDFEEEEVSAIGMFGYDDEEEETSDDDIEAEKEKKEKEKKAREKAEEEKKAREKAEEEKKAREKTEEEKKAREKAEEGKKVKIKEEKAREEKEKLPVKKVIKKIPEELPVEKEDKIPFIEKAKSISGTVPHEKKKVKKKVSKVKTSSASIEDKVKAIEESMQKSMEEKFIKINKDKIKKVVKKKVSK